ncbi:hypothetical protein BDL97_18G041400 [Sphagnum fallax]|nr:hypothetical protein BDL97_18G041400 [Sphagnum fallax]
MATMGAKSLGAWCCFRSGAEDSGICRISEMSRRPSARMMIAFPCLSSSLSFISSLRLSHSSISSSSRPRAAPGSLGFESHFHTVQREFTHRLEARSPGSNYPQLWEEESHPSSVVSSGCCEQPSSRRTGGVVLSPVESQQWKQGVEELGPSNNHPLEVTLQAGSLQHDVGVTFLVLLGGYVWVKVFNSLTKRQILGQKLSRKIVHITSGLLFALCWPFFSVSPWARYLAALVPASNGVRLLVYGLGILKDDGLVKSVSREGDPRELLRGPLYYVVVLVFCTILFWRDSPLSIIALAMMCAGDGGLHLQHKTILLEKSCHTQVYC